MPSYRLLMYRFPYGGREDSTCVDWLMHTYHKAKLDKRFSEVRSPKLNDTPITMTRNAALLTARKLGYDFVLMVDSDMSPDHELLEGDPTAKPFFDVACDELLGRPRPAIIAAPYVGPPPHENIYVFQWANKGNTLDVKAARPSLDQFSREQASMMAGVQKVGALPTGLMMIDLRVLDKHPHPYTYYEYEGGGDECPACHQRERGPEAKKISTEDVTFSRDIGLRGFDVLCAWDSWAGHNKVYTARKPRPYTADIVAARMRESIVAGRFAGEQIIEVPEPDWLADHERTLAAADAELARLVNTRGQNGFNVEIDRENFLRPERGVVNEAAELVGGHAMNPHGIPAPGNLGGASPDTPLPAEAVPGFAAGREHRPVQVVNTSGQALQDGGHVIRLTPVVNEGPVPNGTRVPVQVVGPDNVTRVVMGMFHNCRVVADASSTVAPPPPADPKAPPPNPEPARPWEQHIPPAFSDTVTPADLLAGVPLG